MDNEKILETLNKYKTLLVLYKKRFFPNLIDDNGDGFSIHDHAIFPNQWFSIYDYDFKAKLLEEALSKNTKLEELEFFSHGKTDYIL